MPRPSSPREPARSTRPDGLSPSSCAADCGTLLTKAIAGAKQGDVSALHFLYVRYADDVQGYVESIVRDRHEAEHITQEVFAELITAIAGYEHRQGPFADWLLRVARDAALERKNRIAVEQPLNPNNGGNPNNQIVAANPDGSGRQQLTFRGGLDPSWSPHGGFLAFTRSGQIYTMRVPSRGGG
jgi:Sigma-70 region 2